MSNEHGKREKGKNFETNFGSAFEHPDSLAPFSSLHFVHAIQQIRLCVSVGKSETLQLIQFSLAISIHFIAHISTETNDCLCTSICTNARLLNPISLMYESRVFFGLFLMPALRATTGSVT